MHIHTYIHIHICAQPAASVFADVYVGVKTHLCNIHTCAFTSAQNTCKVHVTLTAKTMHIYTYLHICIRIHMHAKTHAHAWHRPHAEALIPRPTIYAQTCIHIHIHTCINKRIDVQIHTHMHIYTYIHVRTHTHIHIYTHTHTKCIYKHTQARLERRRGSERARSRCRPRKLCTSLSFDAINHISHLQCKDFIVPTSCSTNTPPAVQQSRSTQARRNPSPRMIKVTVQEKRRVNEEQPTPASSPSRKSR